MSNYTLGTIEASEQLIKDLYINLRNEVNKWSEITKQTPQARMGYIGQHLVSVVTGYPGGKSGARGRDLIIDDQRYGEIKTCYRVDQLGQCADCHAVVSSLEETCSSCGSSNIDRKDDSKWLIGIRHDSEFSEILDPESYYFVLFEFEDLYKKNNKNIIASIWEVNPKTKGFAYCMIDYYLNIRANSTSKAPFNMWPYQLKFLLTNPKLIYRSTIYGNGNIKTTIFPTLNNGYIEELKSLQEYKHTRTLSKDALKSVIREIAPHASVQGSKEELIDRLENLRISQKMSNKDLCDYLSDAIYLPLIEHCTNQIPEHLRHLINF